MSLAAHINEQARAVNLNPSDGQKKAGNYQKGHVRVHGLDISIENPKGSYRSGVSPSSGKPWKSRLPHHYGYIRKTEGGDGDHLDVYLGPHLKSPDVYVIDQHDLDSGFWDEHKAFIGFGSMAQAKKAYHAAFSDGRGNDRIGHIARLSVPEFKEWLKTGETTMPLRRASGGRTEGPPPFEETSDIPPFDQTEPVEKIGKGEAFVRGAAQGATFNQADEIAGARAAAPKWVPEFLGPLPAKTAVGAVRSFVSDEGAKDYTKARDEFRARDKLAKEQDPYYLRTGGEFAGMVPSVAAVPEVAAIRAAPQAGRLAKFGYDALRSGVQGGMHGGITGAGEGEDLAGRVTKAYEGIMGGIVGGAAARGVTGAVGTAYDKFARPIVETVSGYRNPIGEGARRVASWLRGDQEMIQSGKARGLTPQQWEAARQRGEPVTLADLGAARTHSGMRSAANTSPEARQILEGTFSGPESRFAGQSERVGETVRNILPGGRANARQSADQLVAAYDQARVPLYKQAYADGDKPLMSPAMERLMGSDTFVNAMKRAISTGKDRDIEMGLGGFNPMVNVTPDGRIVFNQGAKGVPTYPNLQYWDQVKRELDSVAEQARRSGDTASGAGSLAKILRNELDAQVPSYRKARGVAEDYFGEKNALEAGRALAGKKPVAEDVKAIMRKMDPEERELFREGYTSQFVEGVIGRMKDTQDITKAMFNSPNERKLAAAIYGPGGMAILQSRMALETIMNGARDALGNSTTARQLIEAGLAGGAVEGYLTGGDWTTAATHGIAGAAAGAAGHKFLGEHISKGVGKLIGKIDVKTARRVAELLTSDDPRLLQEGYRMVAKNEAIKRNFMALANKVFLAGQSQASRAGAGEAMRIMKPGVVPGQAEEQQSP